MSQLSHSEIVIFITDNKFLPTFFISGLSWIAAGYNLENISPSGPGQEIVLSEIFSKPVGRKVLTRGLRTRGIKFVSFQPVAVSRGSPGVWGLWSICCQSDLWTWWRERWSLVLVWDWLTFLINILLGPAIHKLYTKIQYSDTIHTTSHRPQQDYQGTGKCKEFLLSENSDLRF